MEQITQKQVIQIQKKGATSNPRETRFSAGILAAMLIENTTGDGNKAI